MSGSQIEFYGGYQVYSESGVDLTLLRENLKRSGTERLTRNEQAVRSLVGFQAAVAFPEKEGTPPRRPTMALMALDIEGILRTLTNHQVRFILVGGLAMRLQGSAHITDDLDICYDRAPENLAALVTALAPFHPNMRGAPPGLPFRLDIPTIQAGLNFTLMTDLGDLDLLGEVAGVGRYEQALAQSEEKTTYGLSIRVLTLEGLLASKKAAGRRKDQNHILELEELKKLRDTAP